MQPIIEVNGLSKKYRLGESQPYYTLRDSLAGLFKNPLAAAREQLEKDEFWALKDVNFTVNQGEVVGIIGRNGAGKSTLLKILSQITPPTEGEVILRGRVGSLLEVGTGFSPELTGRENIYLNGAVLGMKRSEVKRKFDEIVAFSEVEKFLDTPLKHFSSGMYMRLAFAVAAHLEPEILIVDEVLAVGDAEFQKKCLGKMGEVAGEGRTVLFVSHNLASVQQLCSSAILLDNGSNSDGKESVERAIKKYQKIADKINIEPFIAKNNEYIDFNDMYLSNKNGSILEEAVNFNNEVYLNIKCQIKMNDPSLQIGYALFNDDGIMLYWSCYNDSDTEHWPQIEHGNLILRTKLPIDILQRGSYKIKLLVSLFHREWIFNPLEASPSIGFQLEGKKSNSPFITTERPGVLMPVFLWEK